MPGLFSWHLRISLEHLQQHSPTLLLAQADPSWDNDRTPSQKSLSATYNPLITTAQGEWCQGSGMCDAVLWRCTVCVSVCVSEGKRGGEGRCQTVKKSKWENDGVRQRQRSVKNRGGKCGASQRRKAGGDLGWLVILPEGHRQRWHGWVE